MGWCAQDMRQVWTNCSLFNHKDTVVGKIGSRADAKFEQLWAASGYDQGGRRRRVTGGIAAHKYEPSLDPEPKPPARKASSGGQRNGRRVRPCWPSVGNLCLCLTCST